MTPTNPKVDFFFTKAKNWQEELELFRSLILACDLDEELKWGVACYGLNEKNILLIHGFKEYCAILFVKGILLHDPAALLIQQTENTQSARQLRFTSVKEILEKKDIIEAYIKEAIEIELAGLKVDFKKEEALNFPEELQHKLDENLSFKTAFEALTPGRQKAYVLFFAGATQAKTREARIDKYMQQILNGKGLNDCTCGLTKKKPNCDGSHKILRQ